TTHTYTLSLHDALPISTGDENAGTGGASIHGDAATHRYATAGACAPAKISGVDQTGRAGQRGINLAHEKLAAGLTSSLERSGCDRKIGCTRSSSYVDGATHIERETSSILAPIRTRNICGIDQVRAGRIQFADK